MGIQSWRNIPFPRFLVIVVASIFLLSCIDERGGTDINNINSDSSTDDAASQYYVALTGSDATGDGSLVAPWQTLQHAVRSVPSGETGVTLNLRAGVYQLTDAIVIDSQHSRSEENRLTIKSYEGESAILDGTLIPKYGAMVSVRNASYVTLERLELTNLIGNKTGIHVTGYSSDIKISNNKIHGMHWTIDPSAAKNPAPEDNLNPIAIVGDSPDPMRNISVVENKVYNLTTGYSEAIKITGNVDGFLVENNEVYDVSNIGIVAAGNYSWVGLEDARLNHARSGIIRKNEVYRCVSPVAASAGIYVDGARNITVVDNNSHHNTVGFSVGSEQPGEAGDIVLSNNIAEDNSQAGVVIGTISADSMVNGVKLTGNKMQGNYTIPVWGGAPIIINKSKNVSIEANEISSISQYMITVNAESDQLRLNNNRYNSTAVDAAQAVFSWAGIDNQTYTSFASYQSATGQDAFSKFGNSGSGIFTRILESIKKLFVK